MNESFDPNSAPTPVDLSISEIVERLRAAPLLDDVASEDVELFASFVTVLRYADGTAICRRGEAAEAMWFMFAGAAKVVVDGDTIAQLAENELIGGRVLLDDTPYGSDVIAVGDTVLFRVSRDSLHQARWHDPYTVAHMLRNVAEVQSSRLRATTRREVEAEIREQQALKLEKRYRRLFFAILSTVGAILLAIITTAEVTSQPKFCGSHHYIKPYYDSWATSTHKDVACPECHFPPGFKGYVLRKYKALAEVAIYVTGSYKGEPHAEVDDEGCLRTGCHIDRLVPGVKKYKNVTFDHRKHLPCGQHHLSADPNEYANLPHSMPPSRAAGEPPPGHEMLLELLPRGRILRCTSCHSNIVQGNHMTVTQSTCFLCHFKTAGETQPISGCPSCHDAPNYKIMVNNVPFEHKPYVERKVPCQQCHTNVTRGDGRVPRERCFQCHDRPARLAEFDNHKLMHEVHVTEHKKDCLFCHTEIEHGAQSITDAMKSDCQRCHQSVQQVYFGQAAGLDVSPDPMFTARVRCDACHRSHENVSGGRESKLLKPNVCGQCHDSKFNGLVEQWKAGGQRLLADMETRLERVEKVLESARAAGNLSRDTLWSATNLYRTAYTNVSTLRHGNPVHNIGFAQKLAAATNAQLVMAMNVLRGRGEAEPTLKLVSLNEPAGGRCLSCHFGIENVKNAVFGKVFEHGKHLLNAGLSCDRCHATTEPEQPGHGSLKIGVDGCMSCHHTTASVTNCKACHDNLRVRQVSLQKPFAHAPHALDYGLNCSTCHAKNAQQTFAADCASCHHAAKVNVAAKCETCHATQFGLYRGFTPAGSPSLHTKAKIGCNDCHVRKGDRMTTLQCSDCHKTGNYIGIRQAWQSKTREQLDTIRKLRRQLGGKTLDGATQRRISAIDAAARRFAVDGSLSVHNPEVVDTTLSRDMDSLQSYVQSR